MQEPDLFTGSPLGGPHDAQRQPPPGESRGARGRPDARRQAPEDERAVARGARPLPWLAALAAAFTLGQLVLVVPGTGLGWDETVYISQVSPQAPAAFFSAPRARGITFLVAPVTELTTSVLALRVYLAVLSGLGLFLALWVWRRLLPTAVLAVAGTLFATLWITAFYASQVMPNLWVAYAAMVAAGCFLRATREPDRRMLLSVAVAVAVAFAALVRPVDAVWLTLPLVLTALLTRARPLLPLLLAPAVGLIAGWAEWIIEAYVRYGGFFARLERASEIQGHLGAYFAVDDHVRALSGRALCRPCDVPWEHPVTGVWFLLLPLFVGAGVWAAARTRYRGAILLAAGTGTALAVPYLFAVGYAAPRFLLPAYLLVSLPVAQALIRVVGAARARSVWRRAAAAGLVLALVGHLAIQYKVLDGLTNRVRKDNALHTRIAAELRAQGMRPPCVITGYESIRVAFRVGCSSRQPGGHDKSITPAGLAAAARHQPVALLLFGDQRPAAYARDWRVHPLPAPHHMPGYRAYLSPKASPLPGHGDG
ncbi:hypothetical protein QIS99_02645 [Streptomyces sp. B-S-A8]|uniref:Glycosyltransferase RgtA/B/C/D-like domain-containing protein n=1 Tax=Streptomyces solicavernae TaxID=3043614 RepID=A0ABT6RL79_9ACTN|nr:hypothetical protein [Streptomyces sp. B-S-A8]MDI3385120.1 hypothetical protein [Streptomyces sp. B-S-A8]